MQKLDFRSLDLKIVLLGGGWGVAGNTLNEQLSVALDLPFAEAEQRQNIYLSGNTSCSTPLGCRQPDGLGPENSSVVELHTMFEMTSIADALLHDHVSCLYIKSLDSTSTHKGIYG